jgi:hypothetical protein
MMSDVDQGQLNIRGINVLRVFGAGGRVTLWGAPHHRHEPELAIRERAPTLPLL